MQEKKTANYKAVTDGGGYRFLFYCDVSDAHVHTTREIYQADAVEPALLMAWEKEGRAYFNRCHKCGRWVMDAVYNAEVLECVECAVYEADPKFCKHCGARIVSPSKVCVSCGRKLVYEGSACNDSEDPV